MINYATDIRKPIVDALLPLFTSADCDVRGENITFTAGNRNWVNLKFDFDDTEAASLGDDGQNITDGMFQINFHWPMSKGDSQQHDLISQISSALKIGTSFTSSNLVVTKITSTRLSPGFEKDGRWVIPYTMYFQSFSNR